MQTPAIQYLHGGFEPFPGLPANDVFRGYAYRVQVYVTGFGASLAHLLIWLPEGKAGQVGRNDKGRDAPGAFTTSACHQRERPGTRCIGNEPLVSGNDIIVTIPFSTGL